jgi:hypothetical protein
MSDDIKKTIKINPEIFNISSSNKKNKTKKIKPTIAPLISPNILKNKLLKRIKEHKLKETEHLDPKTPEINNMDKKPNLVDKQDISKFTDEFNESLEYLQSLSKQNKKNMEKNNIERKKEQLYNKTLRNNNNNSTIPHVELDLPQDLQVSYPPTQLINNYSLENKNQSTFPKPNMEITIVEPSIKLNNYKVDSVIPYGCMKGGLKPTYRDLNKTQRKFETSSSPQPINTNTNTTSLEREKRLALLRLKIKTKEEERVNNPPPLPLPMNTITNVFDTNEVKPTISCNPQSQFIKKTIKQKYTLGKSKTNKSVSILIKDKQTRKNIITAQRDLKRHSINDVKKYLKDHNLIKTGSSAPNDVLRKLYESSILAGEITNSNKDTLIHNLMKETMNE